MGPVSCHLQGWHVRISSNLASSGLVLSPLCPAQRKNQGKGMLT